MTASILHLFSVLFPPPCAAFHLLHLSQEMSAAAARAAPGRMPSTYYGGHEGRRVQVSLKAQSTGTDPLAGYVSIAFAGKTRPFYVHERIPKASPRLR